MGFWALVPKMQTSSRSSCTSSQQHAKAPCKELLDWGGGGEALLIGLGRAKPISRVNCSAESFLVRRTPGRGGPWVGNPGSGSLSLEATGNHRWGPR